MRNRINLAFRVTRRPKRRAVVEVGAAVPPSIPAILIEIAAQLSRLPLAAFDERAITPRTGDLRELHEHFIKEKPQPYQLVSDFDSSNRLLLRHITGATPTTIREWTSAEIPGGVPSTSSWHKLKVKVIADSLWAYYDDTELPGCPFIDTQIDKGYFGIYFFNMLGGSTKCDDIIASAPTGISELGSQAISTLSVYPNPFTNTTTIRYSILDSGYLVEDPTLRVYDACGRSVRSFNLGSSIQDQGSVIEWDGRDAAGKVVAPGVYFIAGGEGTALHKVVRLR